MIKSILRDLTPPIAWRALKKIRNSNVYQEAHTQQITLGAQLLQEKAFSVRAIFVHIHKCAGSSLIDAIEKRPELISCAARAGNFPSRTGRERIPDEIWNKCVKFTFVRNPYDRVVSAYRMFKKRDCWDQLFPTFEDFVEFLRWTNVHDHNVEEEVPINRYMKTIGNITHHCSSFQNQKYLIDQMDYIGRLESFEDDLGKIAQMINIESFNVHHLNKSNRISDYRKYYTARSKEIISHIYRADIEQFDYLF